MTRMLCGFAAAWLLCGSLSPTFAEPKGRPGGKPENNKPAGKPEEGRPTNKPEQGKPGPKPPGGNWSEPKQQPASTHKAGEADAYKNKSNQPSGAEGAAAGAAAANRNQPKASGAEGAAAGAAASNRNQPAATGAEGAAAGAAAANRNQPKATGAEGAAAGAAVANRNQPAVSGAAGAAAGYAAVKNSFDRPDLYGPTWYGANTAAWTAAGWAANAAWTPTPWNGVAAHCGYANATPVSYNFGVNVTCVNGVVVQDGTELGTAEEFSQQASDLALSGVNAQTTDADKWLPLGVFAMVRNDQQHPQLILQLAVNQHGVLRGNYTDETTDHTLPIRGAVDAKSQRAAWVVGANTSSVMEVGLGNLTHGEAPALLHKNGKTDRWVLVRLDQPK